MNMKRSLRSLLGIILILVVSATMVASTKSPASALGGGQLLPAQAEVRGYSLVEAAMATAYFNSSWPRNLESYPEDFPFQILYITPDFNAEPFHVPPGTMLYVPLLSFNIDPPVIGTFPDVNDPAAVSAYVFDPQQMGAEYFHIVVDGQIRELGPQYAAGVETPLPSGTNKYIVVAAFLTPLTPGTHTVTFAGLLSGLYVEQYPEAFGAYPFEFEWTYTIVVD